MIETIRSGQREAAQRGRDGYRRSFRHNSLWNGRHSDSKQVIAIVAERPDRLVVVTVHTAYFSHSAMLKVGAPERSP